MLAALALTPSDLSQTSITALGQGVAGILVYLYSDFHLSIPDYWRGHAYEPFQLLLSCCQANRRKFATNLEKEENNKKGWKQTDFPL